MPKQRKQTVLREKNFFYFRQLQTFDLFQTSFLLCLDLSVVRSFHQSSNYLSFLRNKLKVKRTHSFHFSFFFNELQTSPFNCVFNKLTERRSENYLKEGKLRKLLGFNFLNEYFLLNEKDCIIAGVTVSERRSFPAEHIWMIFVATDACIAI